MVEFGKSRDGADARYRILVVDDSVDSAMVLALALKLQGHISRPVYDGTSALELAPSFRPDVVLLDLKLPDMSGQEVAREIRADPELSQAVLIAVSGYDLEASELKDFDGRVMKPADVDKILELIKRILQAKA